MKRTDLSTVAKIVLLVWIALVVLAIWIMKIAPEYEPITVTLRHVIACKEVGNEWVKVENFDVDESIRLCGDMTLSDPGSSHQIQIRVYEREMTAQDKAIYYDNIWISNGFTIIPIKTYLYPGKYVIQISSGRTTLNIYKLDIVE